MRISDWSSDVCSSDLGPARAGHRAGSGLRRGSARQRVGRRPRSPRGDEAQQHLHGVLPQRRQRLRRPEVAAEDRREGGAVGDVEEAERARYCPWWMFSIITIRMKSSRSEEHTSELQSLMRISYAV